MGEAGSGTAPILGLFTRRGTERLWGMGSIRGPLGKLGVAVTSGERVGGSVAFTRWGEDEFFSSKWKNGPIFIRASWSAC